MNTRRSVRSILAAAVLAAALALAAGASPAVAVGGRPLSAALSGANEVPSGAGDPDGSGSARVTLNQGQGVICFDIEVSNIGTIRLGHIHAGVAGVNGPVVVDFNPAVNGLNGCVSNVDRDLVKAIRQHPEAYYVNIHTVEFPAGAIRGQLSK
jgi:hypothetical protein